MFRSGSTWSFNVVREILARQFGRKHVRHSAQDDIASITKTSDPDEFHIIKAHFLDNEARELIRFGEAAIIHTYRDPVHAVASGKRAFGFPFEQCLDWVARSVELYDLITSSQNGCLLFYDDIDRNPQGLIDSIARYLACPVGRGTSLEIEAQFDREVLRHFTDRLANERQEMEATCRLVDTGFSYYDVQTLLYRNHISKSGEAMPDISAEEIQRIVRNFGSSRVSPEGKLLMRRSQVFYGLAQPSTATLVPAMA